MREVEISGLKYVDCPECKVHIPVEAVAFNNAGALVFVCKECSTAYHHKLGEENPTKIFLTEQETENARD